MSVLGCPESPVRHIYRLWLLWLGVVLTYTAFVYYEAAKPISPTLASIEFVEILAFAIGAGVLSGLFSVNEQKDSLTLSAKIHGVGAAIGFMLLLFFPLTNSILELKCGNTTVGFVKMGAFLHNEVVVDKLRKNYHYFGFCFEETKNPPCHQRYGGFL